MPNIENVIEVIIAIIPNVMKIIPTNPALLESPNASHDASNDVSPSSWLVFVPRDDCFCC